MTEQAKTALVQAEQPELVAAPLAPIAEVRARLADPQHRQLCKDLYCPGASDLEFAHCMATAHHLGLDPIARQIYFIPVYDSQNRRYQMVPVVSIGGLASIAERTGEYKGRTVPQWCGQDGAWRDIWLPEGPPAAAKVGVRRDGFVEPVYGVVMYREYVRRKKDGNPMAQWGSMPAHMLFKCAFAQALRACFPTEMAGDYGIKDVSMPGESGRFRVRDTTEESTPQLIGAMDDTTAGLLEQMQAVESMTKLEALARQATKAPAEHRPRLREAWAEAKSRIEGQAAKPEPSEHDYGPAPMTDAEVKAVESGEQSGFGFDGKGEK